jgi:hypothetical protein
MAKKRIEISFESREQWRIFNSPQMENPQCPICEAESPMLSIENLAVFTRSSQLVIFREIEGGNLHFVETSESRLFVCPATFSKRSYRNNEQEILAKL